MRKTVLSRKLLSPYGSEGKAQDPAHAHSTVTRDRIGNREEGKGGQRYGQHCPGSIAGNVKNREVIARIAKSDIRLSAFAPACRLTAE